MNKSLLNQAFRLWAKLKIAESRAHYSKQTRLNSLKEKAFARLERRIERMGV